MAINRTARNSRAGSVPRTTTTNVATRTTSSAQKPNTNRGNTVSRNVVVVDPNTGKKTLQRNREISVNRGQVYQNGKLVKDYGVGQSAADKAKAFGVQAATSPYTTGQKALTVNMKRESAYTPGVRQVGNTLLQTGTPDEEQGGTPIRRNRVTTIPSSIRPTVTQDAAAEEAARQRIAAERGIDLTTAPAATLSLLDEAAKTDVYGTGRPRFAAAAPAQPTPTAPVAPVEPLRPVTPAEVPSIVTSDYAKTFRGEELDNLTALLGDTFGTVQNGFNDLISSDSDILAAQYAGEDTQNLLAERQAFYEEQYNSLKSEISRIYTDKAADYKIEAAQQMGSTIAQLASMGALGTTTAGLQYVNDVSRLNSAKMLSFAAEEAAALESAYTAFQDADFELAKEMITSAKATREEIRQIKQEELVNQQKMLEIRKLEREDASQTIDAMVQSGLDINELPPGYLEHLDAKGGYAPGTSAGLWNVAQKARVIADAKTEQEAETLAIENAQNMATFLEGTATGGTVSIGGVDYQILAKGDVVTGSEIDASGNVTVWSLDKGTGEIKTHSLGNIGSPAGWEQVERNGVLGLFNSSTGEFKVVGDTGTPNLGYASGGIMDILPQGSINYSGRHQNEGSTARNIWMDAQCGSFVNDMTGIGVGDTWESKQAKMTNDISGLGAQERLSRVPSVGDVFVQKIGSNNLGHVGIVNSVIPIYDDAGNIIDYQLSLTESNWKTTKDAATLQAYGIDPSVLNDSTVAQRGIGLVTHDRTMKLSDPKLTGFASPGFKDPAYNFSGTDAGADSSTSQFFAPATTTEEPKVYTMYGKPMVWDATSGKYISAPTDIETADTSVSANKMLTEIDYLLSSSGLNNAVGPNRFTRNYGLDTFSGEQAAFTGGVENILTNLTIDKLMEAKANGVAFGALSNDELNLIASAASAISSWKRTDDKGNIYYAVSEDAFKREMNKIRALFEKDAGASANIRVRVKATGETGMLPESEFDSNVYERI